MEQLLHFGFGGRDAERRTVANEVPRFYRLLLSPHEDTGGAANLVMLRARDAVVAARIELINATRGLVKSTGTRSPKCSSPSFGQKVEGCDTGTATEALLPLVQLADAQSDCIKSYGQRIEELANENYGHTKLLCQVKGVGPITALAYALTLENPERFAKSRDVGPYLGLVPQQEDSGDSQPQLRISKAGDRIVRRLLVGRAHCSDSSLSRRFTSKRKRPRPDFRDNLETRLILLRRRIEDRCDFFANRPHRSSCSPLVAARQIAATMAMIRLEATREPDLSSGFPAANAPVRLFRMPVVRPSARRWLLPAESRIAPKRRPGRQTILRLFPESQNAKSAPSVFQFHVILEPRSVPRQAFY